MNASELSGADDFFSVSAAYYSLRSIITMRLFSGIMRTRNIFELSI